MKKLTQQSYWDQQYANRKGSEEIRLDGLLNQSNRDIFRILERLSLQDKRVLEIGAGDSSWLPFLARQFPNGRFSGLDYSELGCSRLISRSQAAGAAVTVIRGDLFSPDAELAGAFDVVISFGVAEHFDDLGAALGAMERFLAPKGVMFTLIPNLSGVMGGLAKFFNQEIYEQHVAHDWHSFESGHRAAGLSILEGGYLGANDFRVLSSCINRDRWLPWLLYAGLCSLSVGAWATGRWLATLPPTKTFSPYLYAVSQCPARPHVPNLA